MLTIYTKSICPYCTRAKAWLQKHDIAYEEVDISENEGLREMLKEHGHRTVPQIYLNGQTFVEGGYEGLSQQDPAALKARLAGTV